MGEKEDDDLSTGVVSMRPDLVKKALARGADPNMTIKEVSVLHIAALNGSLAIVDMLLEAGADANGRGTCQDTPLHFACAGFGRSWELIAGRLIRHGANVNAPGINGNHPLDLAARKSNKGVARVLLEAGGRCSPENQAWADGIAKRPKGR